MGELIQGQWHNTPIAKHSQQGAFVRPRSSFRHTISNEANTKFSAEKDRYHLYIAAACPWAHRTLIMRQLKGLEEVITVSAVTPIIQDHGWEFDANHPDPLDNKQRLYEIYQQADPQYSGRVTVPVLFDKHQRTIVNNESSEIMRILNSAFEEWAQTDYDAYPPSQQTEIDQWNALIYEHINNGVYRCGFATSQTAYNEAYQQLFATLDQIEQHLGDSPYLCGEQHTEADWRLFVTLIRFDAVYYSHFKCNRQRIQDYPHLHRYVSTLYHWREIKNTVNFDEIKTHYYASHKAINPTGIIPNGPTVLF